MKSGKCLLLAAALASAVLSAHAQSVPKPKEFYFDEDKSTARPIIVVEGEGEPQVQALVRERERGRRHVEATAQLAHIAAAEGRAELADQLYLQAVSATEAKGTVGRAIRWNYGWDLYRAGQFEPALMQWSEIVTAYGSPSWAPPTLALVLWRLDRKQEAVAWFGAAVRTEPGAWMDARNFASRLPDWRQEDRDMLAEVLGAWQANPPVWP
ncbi:tetratricopeptide repeat protein [Pseudoxanthomonas japonensis]|uniref:tetratricopeptide repeat protein n=1 Tax=Pseudoxanthomonas japonensis TaxID=69284 RepID=UPI001EE4CF56|nr:tetratricopeptide repeat protein [Pseudoxanthomonas japonensis]